MARVAGTTAGRERFAQQPELHAGKWIEATVNKGMITMLDPADIPPGAMQLIKNANVRFDKTARRAGSILLLPEKPDSNPVLKLAFIKRKDGSSYTFRMTSAGLHSRQTLAWTALTGALTGTVRDRFNTSVVLDRFIFSNNGVDNIKEVDFGAGSIVNLGNAPKYRYVTGFYNRAVGAALRDDNEVLVGWSADGVIDEWDPLVNETAGSSPILDSPSDLSDFITGIFASTNVMILLREQSVWVATKQPIPQNPFYFAATVPKIGCDSPYSAQMIGDDGLAFLDRRSGTVYAYKPGGQIEAIGRPIEKTILQNVDDPQTIFSSYDPTNAEYAICIPQAGSKYVNVWVYNLRGRTWTRNEYYAITSMDDTDLAVAGLQIDQLGDVPIESLTGTIDELSPSSAITSTRVIGRDDGSIAQVDINASTDAPHTDFPALVNGLEYETQLTSKVFTLPSTDEYIAKVVVEYQSNQGGTFLLEYSKNGGATDDSWRVAKEVTPKVLGETSLLVFQKLIKCRRFAWRLSTKEGLFDVLSFEVWTYPSGSSTEK